MPQDFLPPAIAFFLAALAASGLSLVVAIPWVLSLVLSRTLGWRRLLRAISGPAACSLVGWLVFAAVDEAQAKLPDGYAVLTLVISVASGVAVGVVFRAG